VSDDNPRDDRPDGPPPLVRVPTRIDALGRPTEWIDVTPEAASHWDARQWQPLASMGWR
jgi:hypothetical protein